MRSPHPWRSSRPSVKEKQVEIKVSRRTLTDRVKAPRIIQGGLTHRQGDTEVIGDVLERQHGHRPQVMSPLGEENKEINDS